MSDRNLTHARVRADARPHLVLRAEIIGAHAESLSYEAQERIEVAIGQGVAPERIDALVHVLANVERVDWCGLTCVTPAWVHASAFWLVSAGLVSPGEAGDWISRRAQTKSAAGYEPAAPDPVMQPDDEGSAQVNGRADSRTDRAESASRRALSVLITARRMS